MRYFKTVRNGRLERIDHSEIRVSGEEISKTEYEMIKAGISAFIKKEEVTEDG